METRCCRIARHGSKSIARHRETAPEGSSGAYSNVIIEYSKKGYISKVSPSEKDEKAWYLRHFAIVRPENTTTKTRVVFDASAKCNGVSLNDVMSKLQRDAFDVLLRFRRFPTALVWKIAERYLRIGMEPSSRPFHRFLWRDLDQSRPSDKYQFKYVCQGGPTKAMKMKITEFDEIWCDSTTLHIH